MARKLKVFQTSLGFYDEAIAAPSRKAALDAWGANSNLFHQGMAKECNDPDIVAAAISKPGIILRRPVGSDDPFTEHSALPTNLANGEIRLRSRRAVRRRRNPLPGRWTARQRAKPLSHLSSRKSGVIASAGKKRLLRRKNASAAGTPSKRRKQPWKKRNVNTSAGQRPSTSSARPSRRDRK